MSLGPYLSHIIHFGIINIRLIQIIPAYLALPMTMILIYNMVFHNMTTLCPMIW